MDFEKSINNVVAKFFGTKHERDIKLLQPKVAETNALAAEYERLSDEDLAAKTPELRAIVAERLKNADPAEKEYREQLQAAIEPVIVPAFAAVREAGRRKLNMRHFDVQLIGGIVLHEGKIAEMKT
ncbi:MAG TPA: hypothetical protein VFO34_10410, partial [Candidatus Acidoferrales bacterium]|nr:hypothetical protein [Candidatus Acidoferrales bacterium]